MPRHGEVRFMLLGDVRDGPGPHGYGLVAAHDLPPSIVWSTTVPWSTVVATIEPISIVDHDAVLASSPTGSGSLRQVRPASSL